MRHYTTAVTGLELEVDNHYKATNLPRAKEVGIAVGIINTIGIHNEDYVPAGVDSQVT